MNTTSLPFRFLHAGFLPWQARHPNRDDSARPQDLPRNGMLTLDNRHLQLRVLSGCVWITRDGCPADLVLDAGEVFEQRPGAPVLVQALDDAQVLIAT